MQEDTQSNTQKHSMPNDRLWDWEFGRADWICLVAGTVLFLALVAVLYSCPEVVERSRMMPTTPLVSIPFVCAALIIN